MSTTETTSTTGRLLPALLAGVVVALVLGIIGMHTLNTHGVLGNNTDHAAMTMPADPGTPMSGDMITDTHGGVAGSPAATSAGPGGDPGHGLGHTLMLCVAMLTLAAGALLLVRLALRRLPRGWAHPHTASATATRWVTARLGAGPPPAWEFSVIRC